MATFFAKTNSKFSPLRKDGNIEVGPFLDATRELLPFIDLLGSALKPVRSDIQGNITKLQKVYDVDQEKFSTLKGMLVDDIEKNNSSKSDSATIALLWLNRALHYIVVLLQLFVEDYTNGTKSATLHPLCCEAYGRTLKKYHGWVVQKLFGVVSKAAPYSEDFINNLAFGCTESTEQVIEDMAVFSDELSQNVEGVHQLYAELNLKFENKI